MKKPTVSKLKKKADQVFSLWIRNRDSKQGYCKCISCGVVKPIAEMQNGHYYSRSINYLRYDPRNCAAQCVGCNIFKEGNKPAYALALIRKYGKNILEELEKDSRKYKQWTIQDLEKLIKKYANPKL